MYTQGKDVESNKSKNYKDIFSDCFEKFQNNFTKEDIGYPLYDDNNKYLTEIDIKNILN